jgi:hypothetical protein
MLREVALELGDRRPLHDLFWSHQVAGVKGAASWSALRFQAAPRLYRSLRTRPP